MAAVARADEPLPRGRVIEKIVCKSAPDQSYALYLPAAYTPEKRWPVLYALDARGREGVTKSFDGIDLERLAVAARKRMQEDERRMFVEAR